MPWNHFAREQVSGWRFLFRRLLLVALGRRTARLIHDPSKNNSVNNSAARLVSAVGAVLLVGLCFMLAVFNPAGQIGGSPVLADRAGSGLYDTAEGYR
jgi:hypothetical protein